MRQLKQEIESLKESSQLVDNSSYYQSIRESIAEENDYRDMPLQMGVARSRQRSVRLKEEGKDKYQQEATPEQLAAFSASQKNAPRDKD